MRLLLGSLGLLLILLDLADIIQTTLSVRGGGFLSSRMTALLWTGCLRLHRRYPTHRVLAFAGPAILVLTLSFWTLLVWLGWTLVFLSDPGSVVAASGGEPGSVAAQFYFVGYTLITLGIGDYRPQGALWQLATVLAAAQGFFVVSLSISYLLSVLPAVVTKRQTALYIATLGLRPVDIVLFARQGEGCGGLDTHLSTLMTSLGKLTEQHLAYPVLHYFHAPTKLSAFGLRVAALDEALHYLRYGVKGCEAAAQRLEPLERTLTVLLTALQVAFISAQEAPLPQTLNPLKAHGVAVKDEEAFAHALQGHTERRKLLYSLVRKTGWTWEDLSEAQPNAEAVGELGWR